MPASPRIVTVDPSGTVARIVRATVDLLDRQVVLVDIPDARTALNEVKGGQCTLVVTAVELFSDIKGIQLAIQTRRDAPDTSVIILADPDDPTLDEETLAESPFVYLRRPVDMHQFVRVLMAGLDGEDIFGALKPASADSQHLMLEMGPVPRLDSEAARSIIDRLLTDVGAMAIILASREGEVLLERGAVGYIDRERLARALVPMIATTIDMSDLVGGRTSAIQYFDGEEYDVFVLSVGLHHFLCIVMDGQAGNRQFGAVNRFGRRAAEDLIALLGAAAFVLQRVSPPAEARQGKRKGKSVPSEESQADLTPIERPEIKVKEPEPLQLAPIEDLDLSIFDQLDKLNVEAADDLFDPERLAEIASETRRPDGPIDIELARQLGIIPDLD